MQKSNWLKPFAITSIALLAFAGLAGCQGKSDQASSAAKTPLGNEATTQPSMTTTDTNAKVASGKIIATINGQPLYQENLEVIQSALPKAMPEQHLVERMIELRLLASAARQEGLDKQIKTQAQIQNAVDNQLANDYLSNYLSKMEVTDAVLQPEYDKFVKGYPSTTQYKAAHILVKTKEEAEAIKDQLRSFLHEHLKLELSVDKTLITHATSHPARFLGYHLSSAHADSKQDQRGRRTARRRPSRCASTTISTTRRRRPEPPSSGTTRASTPTTAA